jgi:hypothetical protein
LLIRKKNAWDIPIYSLIFLSKLKLGYSFFDFDLDCVGRNYVILTSMRARSPCVCIQTKKQSAP